MTQIEHPPPFIGTTALRGLGMVSGHTCSCGTHWHVLHRQGSESVSAYTVAPPQSSIFERERHKPVHGNASYVETVDGDDEWTEVFSWACGDHETTFERVTLKPDDGILCRHCNGTGTNRVEGIHGAVEQRNCWCCHGGEAGVVVGRHRTLSKDRCDR